MKNSLGFTLIELLVVVAIIGILAAVAMPYYEGYMIRAKLLEVERAMATIKSAASSYRQEKEVWPNCPDISAVSNSLGVGLGAAGRISAVSVAAVDGSITATVQNIDAMVDNKTIILRPIPSAANDGSFSWVWDYGPGFPVQLRQRGY